MKTKPTSWRSVLITALLTAFATALGTNMVTNWLPKLIMDFRRQSILFITVAHNQQPVSEVKFTVLKPPFTSEPLSSGTTDSYGYVSLSTGTGLLIVQATLCNGPSGQDMEYSKPLTIESLPLTLTLELDKDFRKLEKPICASQPSIPASGEITNVTVTSNKNYIVAKLDEESIAYTDRSYRYTNIPSTLRGQSYIITANEDKCPDNPSTFYLRFDVARPVTVYIAHDDRYAKKPTWMAGFSKTTGSLTLTLPGTRQKNSLYQKEFAPGTILLRSNIDGTCQEEGNFAMYSVIVVSRDAQVRSYRQHHRSTRS